MGIGPEPPKQNRTREVAQATRAAVRLVSVAAQETRPAGGRAAWIEAAMAPDSQLRAAVVLSPGVDVPGTRYRIRRWLGEGAMGVVYEAEHLDLGRRVALKILRRELCRDATMSRLFREEARIASGLGAENVVEVFDFGELPDGRLMFTMELLQGRMLADELDGTSGEPMPAPRAVGIARQVCKGLAVAHAASVIHRDIKPANIALSTRDGRIDAVKLLDFGIASVAMGTELDGDEAPAGTPYYLAPELIAGRPHDHRVDIYALGCTVYEMLVGRPPFDGASISEILSAHLHADPVAPTDAVPTIPTALSEVIVRCLAKDPDERFSSVADLEAALVEAQIDAGFHTAWDDLPMPDVDPDRRARLVENMPDPVSRWYQDGRRWVWLGAAMLVAVILGGSLTFVVLRTSEMQQAASLDRVEDLARGARAAAAKSLFVYPTPDAPTEPTAYLRVLELEGLSDELGTVATERANELRRSFATTLVRLGDEYWARDGGKPFSIDYYAAALVFEPAHARARERVGLTPGQIAVLEEKAGLLAFSRDELLAAEALIALAEPSSTRRAETLTAIAEKQRRVLERRHAELGELAESARSQRVVASPGSDAVVAARQHEPRGPTTNADEQTAETIRDLARARALAERGRAALAAGTLGEAKRLFESALAQDSGNVEATVGLARVHFHEGNYAKAARYAKKGVRAAPRNADHRILLGDASYKAYRYEEAREQYAYAKQLGHRDAEGRLAKVASKLAK